VNISGKSRIKLVGSLLAALLLAFCLIQSSDAGGWDLKDKDGIPYRLSDLKGKWVLVNFWAPWCPPCLQEMPEFSALARKHKDLLVIGVAVMYRKKQEVLDVVKTQSITYPIVLGNEDIASEFGEIEGLPTSFLYAPSGKLVGRHDGALSREDVEKAMHQKSEATDPFKS
jgi:thiol-disulfide isomerase/thioredoxin